LCDSQLKTKQKGQLNEHDVVLQQSTF
jgi:hypothetical protein